jgi:hypothetical protein
MKASEWIRDALQELGQLAAEQPVTPDQFQTGIRYANRLMASHENLGLGYTIIDNANDTVTIPAYAEEWAVYGLAVRMSTQFGPNESIMELKDKERTAYRQLLKQQPADIAMDYPSILPIGSGNPNWDCDRHFYPGPENNLTTEQGDYLIAED